MIEIVVGTHIPPLVFATGACFGLHDFACLGVYVRTGMRHGRYQHRTRVLLQGRFRSIILPFFAQIWLPLYRRAAYVPLWTEML